MRSFLASGLRAFSIISTLGSAEFGPFPSLAYHLRKASFPSWSPIDFLNARSLRNSPFVSALSSTPFRFLAIVLPLAVATTPSLLRRPARTASGPAGLIQKQQIGRASCRERV